MLHSFFERRTFPLVLLVFVHFLLLLPGGSFGKEKIELIPHADKIVHFGLYFMMVGSWVVFFNLKDDLNPHQKRTWNFIIVLLAIGDGIIVEFMQASPLIHRDFDWLDALADGIGAIAGLIAGLWFTKKIKRPPFT
ncbi:MAG: hypothetical protein MUE38_07935 [Flavihumibacter sp.]|nr:hypothetical protein [Flavihumibacter sp.]